VVRHGAEKATVAAVYESDDAAIAQVLEENGIDGAGTEIILRRDIALNGKGRVFINNQPATVAVLKALAPRLAIIHAQNQAILMFDPPERLALLDAAASVSVSGAAEAYARWKDAARRIAELEKGEQEKLRLVDLWEVSVEGNSRGWSRHRRRPEARSRKARAGKLRAGVWRGPWRIQPAL